MCDPITIIGLAASVVQIVDLTGRLISKSCEIYSSVDGALRENVDLEFLVTDLQKTNAKLARIPLQVDDENVLDQDDKALRQLCCGCNEVAEELLSQLAVLKIRDTDDPRKLASVKSAWKFMRSKKELDALAARVAAFREQLHMRLLVSITDRFQGFQLDQKCRFDSLDRSGRDIIDSIKHTRTLISGEIGEQTEYLTSLAKSHHEEILHTLSIIVDNRSISRSSSPNALEEKRYIKAAGVPSVSLHQLLANGDHTGMHLALCQKPDAIFDVNSDGETPLHIAARNGDIKAVAYLIRKGANKNADNRLDQTPLHLATTANHLEVMRLLVSKGADPDTEDEHGRRPEELAPPESEAAWILKVGPGLEDRDPRGYTLLRALVNQGDLAGVRSLLDRGADVEAKCDTLNATALKDAAMKQDIPMMELLISCGANLEARDDRDGTAVIDIAWHGLAAPLKVLLEHGADINAVNETGATALHEVAWHNHPETAEVLLQYDVNLDALNYNGDTPLALAVDSRSIKVLHMLLDKGAELDIKCCEGETALYSACAKQNVEMVAELLKRGADAEIAKANGYTPLCITTIKGNVEIMKLLLAMEEVHVDAKGKDGYTALIEAVNHEQPQMARILLDNGASLEKKCDVGYTALTLAGAKGNAEIMGILLGVDGVNVHMEGVDGHTALHEAAYHGHLEVAKLLVESGGASVTVKSNFGRTPSQVASQMGNSDIAQFLREYETRFYSIVNRETTVDKVA